MLQAQMVLLVNFTKHLHEMIPILYNLFHKIAEDTTPNSFYEASITLILKPVKDIRRQEKCRIQEYRCITPQQFISKLNYISNYVP